MSKKRNECCKEPMHKECCGHGSSYGMGSYTNIYSLLILILIVCQFCKKKNDDDDECESHGIIDNSILFIIVIFLLVYCSCRKSL